MAPIPNPRVLYTKIPGEESLVPGEHLRYDNTPTIDPDSVHLKGGFLTKTLVLSPEPYMRERMRDAKIYSYSTPMKVGQPLVGFGLVKVLRSEKEGVKVGDYMLGFTPWEAYTVQPYVDARADYHEGLPAYTVDMDALALQTVPDPKGAFPLSRYCGVLGIPGLSAFVALEKYTDAKAGETIYISAGASGVGTIAIQLAKIKGLRVITSAGSDEKVNYLRTLGADAAFNYKTTTVSSALAEHGPVDIYFDNVGGEHLEAAIDNMNLNGRIVICGAISEYNIPREQRYGIKNLSTCFKRRLTIRGFLVADSPELNPRFFNELPALLAQGKIQSEEHAFEGLEQGVSAFLSLFDGRAKGKVVVVVDKEN